MKKATQTPVEDDPKQSERFIETAKAAGATGGGLFARVFKKIVPKKKKVRQH